MADKDFSTPLAADVLGRLGLQHDPFVDEAGDFLIADAAFVTQTNVTLHMLQVGDRVLLVRGPEGIGKTQFLHRVLERKPAGLGLCLLRGEPGQTLGELLGALLRRLDLAAAEGESLPVEQALARLGGSARAGVRPVLLIDDAERLDAEVLDQLLELWQQAQRAGEGFGLMLSGGPGLDRRVDRLTSHLGSAQALHQIQLYPYSPQQSDEYLTQALRRAGDSEEGLLDSQRKRQIHVAAGGIPAELNRQARRALAESARHGSASPGRRRRGWMIGGAALGGLALAGILGSYLLQPADQTPAASDEGASDSPFGLKMPERYAYDREGSPARTPAAGAMPVQRQPAGNPPAQEPNAEDQETGQAPQATEPTASPAPDEQAPAARAETPPAAQAPVQLAAEEGPQTAGEEPAPAADAGAGQASPTQQPAGTASAPAAQVAPAPSPAQASPTAETTLEQALARGRAWVSRQPAEHYTLQLLAAYDVEIVWDYVQRHGLQARTAIVRTRRQDRDWYILLTGHYSSANWAREGLKRLEPALREYGPWIRSFGDIRRQLPR